VHYVKRLIHRVSAFPGEIGSPHRAGRRGRKQTGGGGVAAGAPPLTRKSMLYIRTPNVESRVIGSMKSCSTCKKDLPLELFPVRRASQDGLGYICKPCVVVRSRAWRAKNREAHRASVLAWQKANKDKVNQRSREWRIRNAERRAASCRAWNERNRDKRAEAVARRRAKLVTPKWADAKAIARFYREAKRLELETGVPHHVDHIVPLNSELVCGLHVESNLQVIPARENVLKRNLAWPDMP
jgi:hypothetical protein